jgi:hypothetical protein
VAIALRRIASSAAIAALASACAVRDVPLTLPTKGLEDTIRGGRGRQVIVTIPFEDGREPKRCGMRKNEYSVEVASVVCQSDPAVWIALLLADELRASGFDVLAAEAEHRPGALRIDGTLFKLFVEPVIGVWTSSLEADLAVTLRVSTQTGLEAERRFFVKGWKGGVVVLSLQPYLTATHRAAQALLDEMVRAIIELMDRHPQLGSNDAPPAVRAPQLSGRAG